MAKRIGYTKSETERFNNDDPATSDYIGVVVDSNDPERQYRCKVRVYGKFDDLPDDLLPWALPETAYFGGTAGGAISYPKPGTEVRVNFFEGDIYHPYYKSPVNVQEGLLSEVRNSYEDSHVLLFDENEGLKVVYTKDRGFYINLKNSEINIKNDNSIVINHRDSSSTIEIEGPNIRIVTNSKIDATSQDSITLNSNVVHANGLNTKLGANPVYSNVNGEPLFALLQTIANAIDAKWPSTPGVTAGLVSTAQPVVLSTTVQTTS